MATTDATELVEGPVRRRSIAPTPLERVLACGCIVLLVAVLGALVRGHHEWDKVPGLVWLHLVTIGICLVLTPILLLGRRGVRRHRQLGYAWVASMTATALLTFGIRESGGLSPIHVLSVLALTQAPMLAWHAHHHRVDAHRTTVLSMVGGALLIAGFFTFPFGRMLGRWLLG